MTHSLKAGLAAAFAIVALAGSAQAFDLKIAPPAAKVVPTKLQLGIISPKNCPGFGKLTAWVQTNKPGKVNILLVKKGGSVYGPYPVTTTTGSGGVVLGSYTQAINVVADIDAEYRIVVAGSPLVSNWAPLTADC